MNDPKRCIDVCNQLLRGELSAVETYDHAISKYQETGDATLLVGIRDDHQTSCALLKEHLLSMGATPDANSGAWGNFVKAVEGTAALMGSVPALTILEQGEEHGVSEYEDALKDPEVMIEIKSIIRARLLPPLEKHISTLKRLYSPAA